MLIKLIGRTFDSSLKKATTKLLNIMKAVDLKKGSIVEIITNLSPEKMNTPVQVEISRCTDHYLWFKGNVLQRMGRSTFQDYVNNFGYKIISI